MDDLTGTPPSVRDIEEATRAVQEAMVRDIVKLPPGLAVQLPNIHRCLEELARQATGCPDDLRADGWSVAVHNDYRIDGRACTFWLLTHPDGRYVKGEGSTDAEALGKIRVALEGK